MSEQEYKNAQTKIYIFLVVLVTILFFFVVDKDFPRWWSQEISIILGLAAWGLCYWLAGIIDDWLRRD